MAKVKGKKAKLQNEGDGERVTSGGGHRLFPVSIGGGAKCGGRRVGFEQVSRRSGADRPGKAIGEENSKRGLVCHDDLCAIRAI